MRDTIYIYMIILSAETNREYLKDWRRVCDEMYEVHSDRLRDAMMERWRDVAYYICLNCRETYTTRNFHLVPIVHKEKDMRKPHNPTLRSGSTLQPLCHSCYLYFANGIIE